MKDGRKEGEKSKLEHGDENRWIKREKDNSAWAETFISIKIP